MSSQKEDLVSKIREHFQSKYKGQPNLSQVLEKELSEISKKSTISKNDLDEIDTKLAKMLGSTTVRRDSYSINQASQDKSPRIVQSTRNRQLQLNRAPSPITESIRQHRLQSRPASTNNKAPLHNRLPNAPGFCDNSMYFFSPMDLMVLKKNQLINEGRRSVHQRSRSHIPTEQTQTDSPLSREAKSYFVEESLAQNKEKSGSITPLKNRLPLTQKNIDRQRKITDDIWHKIEDKHIQKMEDAEKAKEREQRERTTKWAQELKMQIEQKMMNNCSRKNQDIKESLKHYESEEFMQLEHLNKVNKRKENIYNVEKTNYAVNMNNVVHRLKVKNDTMDQESFDLKMRIRQAGREAENDRRIKLEKMNQLRAIREVEIAQNAQKTQMKKKKEMKEDDETLKIWLEKRDHQDITRQKYLDHLKYKALHVPAYQPPALDKTQPEKRKTSLDPQKDTNNSLMKFLDAEPHTEVWRKKIRNDLQKINELHSQYTLDKAARETAIKSYYNEQQDLWKEQEENFELRERLTKEAQKLKKIAQRQALDEQIRQDKEIKHSKLTEAERRWNRSIIRELNVENRHKSVQEA